MLVRILLATSPPSLHRRVERLLAIPNALVHPIPPDGLWEGLAREGYDLVVVSRSVLPDPPAGVVGTIRKIPDRPELIVLQDHEDDAERAVLLGAGCLAVLARDLPDPALAEALSGLVQRRREAVLSRIRGEIGRREHRFSDFATANPTMARLVEMARRVAAADSSVLILGETGVGKEWLARAIHADSPRAASPFIAINCAAVPETLLESELFGHEKGAFTGAVRSRRGHFELAHRGTIFLDEIGDMAPHLQAKLLRVLQERTIQRVGAEAPIAVDVRLMAATHRDLEELMRQRAFRQDLYYRLGVVTLTVPALRDRREDVAELVRHHVRELRQRLGRPVDAITPDAMEALVAYAWPGNVRELFNVLERAVLLAPSSEITLADLPEAIHRGGVAEPVAPAAATPSWLPPIDDWLERPLHELEREVLAALERRYLEEQLRRRGGRIGDTARVAGIDPRSLYNKMRRHGLRKEDFRSSV